MQIASTISPHFIEGFVEQCVNLGLDEAQTEELFRKHANNQIISRPAVYAGFRAVAGSYEGPVSKSAMVRWMTPDMISLAEDVRLHYGDDPMSCQVRETLGLPEPSWDTVPEAVKSAATSLSNVLDEFDYLPLNQKILLAILAGGGLGGMARGLRPTAEDEAMGRGPFNRVTRGALRGAGTGAGAAAGAAAGSDVAGRFAGDLRLPGLVSGATLGGLAGRRLISDVVS